MQSNSFGNLEEGAVLSLPALHIRLPPSNCISSNLGFISRPLTKALKPVVPGRDPCRSPAALCWWFTITSHGLPRQAPRRHCCSLPRAPSLLQASYISAFPWANPLSQELKPGFFGEVGFPWSVNAWQGCWGSPTRAGTAGTWVLPSSVSCCLGGGEALLAVSDAGLWNGSV